MLFCYPSFLYLFVNQLLVKNGYAVLLMCDFVAVRFCWFAVFWYAALLVCGFVTMLFCLLCGFVDVQLCWFAVLWLGIGTAICLEDCVAFDVGGLSIWF